MTFWVSSPSPNAAHAGRCGQCHRHRDDLCAAAGLFAGKLLDVIGRRGGGPIIFVTAAVSLGAYVASQAALTVCLVGGIFAATAVMPV